MNANNAANDEKQSSVRRTTRVSNINYNYNNYMASRTLGTDFIFGSGTSKWRNVPETMSNPMYKDGQATILIKYSKFAWKKVTGNDSIKEENIETLFNETSPFAENIGDWLESPGILGDDPGDANIVQILSNYKQTTRSNFIKDQIVMLLDPSYLELDKGGEYVGIVTDTRDSNEKIDWNWNDDKHANTKVLFIDVSMKKCDVLVPYLSNGCKLETWIPNGKLDACIDESDASLCFKDKYFLAQNYLKDVRINHLNDKIQGLRGLFKETWMDSAIIVCDKAQDALGPKESKKKKTIRKIGFTETSFEAGFLRHCEKNELNWHKSGSTRSRAFSSTDWKVAFGVDLPKRIILPNYQTMTEGYIYDYSNIKLKWFNNNYPTMYFIANCTETPIAIDEDLRKIATSGAGGLIEVSKILRNIYGETAE